MSKHISTLRHCWNDIFILRVTQLLNQWRFCSYTYMHYQAWEKRTTSAIEKDMACWSCNIWTPLHSWWRHQIESFSALLALCAGNPPVTGEFPAQKPVTRCFDVDFNPPLNKRLSKQSWGCWFETLSRPLWRNSNVTIMLCMSLARNMIQIFLYDIA